MIFDVLKTSLTRMRNVAFLIFFLAIAVPAITIMLIIHASGDVDLFTNYAVFGISILRSLAAVLLLVVIARVWDKTFKTVTALIALGFIMMATADWIWSFSDFPDVSLLDALWLGGYVVWIIATLPSLYRYRSLLLKRKMISILAVFALIFTALGYLISSQIYTVGYDGGNDLTIAVYIGYPVISFICLFFMISVALLYRKGTMMYYWLYFIVSIGLLSVADILFDFWGWYPTDFGLEQILDIFYFSGCAAAIAAGIVILKSNMTTISIMPEVSHIAKKGRPIQLNPGESYFLASKGLNETVEVIYGAMEQGLSPLLVSTVHPSLLRGSYDLETVPILWLSNIEWHRNVPLEKNIPLSDLNMLSNSVNAFLAKPKTIVVLIFPEIADPETQWKYLKQVIGQAVASAKSSSSNFLLLLKSDEANVEQLAYAESLMTGLKFKD